MEEGLSSPPINTGQRLANVDSSPLFPQMASSEVVKIVRYGIAGVPRHRQENVAIAYGRLETPASTFSAT